MTVVVCVFLPEALWQWNWATAPLLLHLWGPPEPAVICAVPGAATEEAATGTHLAIRGPEGPAQ